MTDILISIVLALIGVWALVCGITCDRPFSMDIEKKNRRKKK